MTELRMAGKSAALRSGGQWLDRRRVSSTLGVLLSLFLLMGTGLAQTPKAAGGVPLLDRELFFGDPEISGAQLSPDGKFIAFIKPFKGTRNVWVKRTAEPFSAARLVTNDTKRPIPGFFWSRDGRFLLFVQDQGGDENYNVYAVDPAAAKGVGPEVPSARNLTEAKAVRAVIYGIPKSDPDSLFVGINDRDAAWHDLYRVQISTGKRTLLRQNTEKVTGWVFDLKDQLRLATRVADNGDTEVLRVDADGLKKVYSCSVFESCGPVRFHADNRRVYMVTDKGDAVDLQALTLFDPVSGKEEKVESDPEKRVDFGSAQFSDRTDELIATVYLDERARVYWKNREWQADYEFLQAKFPGREIGLGSGTTDETLMLLSVSSDTEPGERYLFDRKKRELTFQYRSYEALPREALAPMEAIRYPSSDGLEIPAYLTLPKGVPAKNLPLVVFPHGGPWARDQWGYDSYAQFLANRGYAVLQPNFRGSTGYGKKFLNAGNQKWGETMQDDLTWGVRHLVAKGIADPKRVGIMGGSYGGYATLAGLAFTPDVYACGVSIVGPSNLLTLLETIPPYWEAARILFHERMGNPGTPEGKARLERQSPLNSANRIKVPLLVIQGANDPRVKKAESDQIVIALRERKLAVEYLVAPDEGHGFARPINNLATYSQAEKFLATHLGGRYQTERKPEIEQRLKEITVDIATVTLPKKIEAASGTPQPVTALRAGTHRFEGKIDLGGQSIGFTAKTEIKEEDGGWTLVETAAFPQGEMTDTTRVSPQGFVPKSRAIRQGPVAIDLTIDGTKVTGSMAMGGNARPIDLPLEGPLFADGAGAFDVLSTLPLADGYEAVFRNLDVNSQKTQLKQLKVVGSEKVTVPAGAFDAWKVEVVSPADGGKTFFWVGRESRNVLRIQATMPQLNGATMTMDRLP